MKTRCKSNFRLLSPYLLRLALCKLYYFYSARKRKREKKTKKFPFYHSLLSFFFTLLRCLLFDKSGLLFVQLTNEMNKKNENVAKFGLWCLQFNLISFFRFLSWGMISFAIWLYWRMNNIWCVLLHEKVLFNYVLRARTHTLTAATSTYIVHTWSMTWSGLTYTCIWALENLSSLLARGRSCGRVHVWVRTFAVYRVFLKRFVNTHTSTSQHQYTGTLVVSIQCVACDVPAELSQCSIVRFSSYFDVSSCVCVCMCIQSVSDIFTCKKRHARTHMQSLRSLHVYMTCCYPRFEQFLGASTDWTIKVNKNQIPKRGKILARTHTHAHIVDKCIDEFLLIIKESTM